MRRGVVSGGDWVPLDLAWCWGFGFGVSEDCLFAPFL